MSKMNNDVKVEKPSKNWGYRLFAVLLIAICAAACVVLTFKTTNDPDGITLLALAQALTAGSDKLFNVIPTFAGNETFYTVGAYLFVVGVAFSAIFSLLAFLVGKKAPAFVRTALFFMAIGALVYTAAYGTTESELELFSLVLGVVALLFFIIFVAKKGKKNEIDVDAIREEAAREATSGFHTEEFVEAYPYEGGPVAGVMMAAEVNPSFLPQEPHVTTAGYDFYNCKSFDPFIATLSIAERNEFTELFILKFKGTMSELPDYVVGGDNKEFFRKIFIYLGQYRDRMSQALLAKMYQYSIKI